MELMDLQNKFDNSEVLTADDFKGCDADEIVYYLKEIGFIEWYTDHYGEPGYNDPKKEILFANWNFLENDVIDKLEEAGYELEWSDEWIETEDGLAYRTQPDSYSWVQSFFVLGCRILGMKEHEEEFVNEYLINNVEAAAPEWVDLTKYGFEKLEDGEMGWYSECKNVSPNEMIRDLPDEVDFVFQITSQGQFCTEYELWVKDPNHLVIKQDKIFVKTENGIVMEWERMTQSEAMKALRYEYEHAATDDKIDWEEVEEDIYFSYHDKYGSLVVYQILEDKGE